MTAANALFILVLVAAVWAVSLLDPTHRAAARARRQKRTQRRHDRDARRARVKAAKEHRAYCLRRWQRIDTYVMAGQHEVAANERARLLAEGVEDPR